MSVPVTNGTGASSVAAEVISGLNYQQIKIIGGETGSTSVLGVNPDRSLSVSVIGTPTVSVSNTINASLGSASVITIVQAPSIVGTFSEDSAHTSGDKGVFSLNVRNDTMSSITSADGDYTPLSTGPVGEVIVANSPITKWVQGTGDLRVTQGASVTVLVAQGASVFTYITSAQVANMGPSSVFVSFGSGLGSVIGYTIAPIGGGSNILFPNGLKTGANSAFTASISGTASVLVSAQGFIAKI